VAEHRLLFIISLESPPPASDVGSIILSQLFIIYLFSLFRLLPRFFFLSFLVTSLSSLVSSHHYPKYSSCLPKEIRLKVSNSEPSRVITGDSLLHVLVGLRMSSYFVFSSHRAPLLATKYSTCLSKDIRLRVSNSSLPSRMITVDSLVHVLVGVKDELRAMGLLLFYYLSFPKAHPWHTSIMSLQAF